MKVHPTYKTRYRGTNWPEYDRALVRRGDLTIWFTPAALRAWTPLPTGEVGGQRIYSDPGIELGFSRVNLCSENTFYRYKKRFGGRLTARNQAAQRNEALTACNILNKRTELGRRNSVALRG
ncbi:MAG: hypothetical protein GWP91_19220 [Rhodobacterales bacterium]|nr:hypothetical protein [Rhodobacterales bacterium]